MLHALLLNAEELIGVEQALAKVFKKATGIERTDVALTPDQIVLIEKSAEIQFDQTHATHIIYYTARDAHGILGYVFEDTVQGKWGPIHYALAVDPRGTILEVVILDYQEIRGRPIAKKRFLRQYQKKSIGDPLRLRSDIDGITGATISSRSLTDGVRKLLNVFDVLQLGA